MMKMKRNFWWTGFKNGFRLGFEGDRKVKYTAPNLKFSIGSETETVEQSDEGS